MDDATHAVVPPDPEMIQGADHRHIAAAAGAAARYPEMIQVADGLV